MSRRTVLILAGTAMLLAGCATQANYRKIVASWVGARADDLVQAWGAPTSSYPLDNGNKILVYEDTEVAAMPTTVIPGTTIVHRSHGTIIADSTPTTISGGGTRVFSCRTEFGVDPRGTIVNWRVSGDNCTARNAEKDDRFRR